MRKSEMEWNQDLNREEKHLVHIQSIKYMNKDRT